MSENSETRAEIIAEMRNLGNLDEKSTDKIPRRLMALGLRTYADRLEAAAKRECGNMAAIREALEICVSDYETSGIDETTEKWHEEHFGAEVQSLVAWRKAKAALAALPRNCDRFVDELDAQLAFLNEVWLITIARETMTEQDTYEKWTDEMRMAYGRWLLARVTEKEGGREAEGKAENETT